MEQVYRQWEMMIERGLGNTGSFSFFSSSGLCIEPTPHDNACRNGSGTGIRAGMNKREGRGREKSCVCGKKLVILQDEKHDPN